MNQESDAQQMPNAQRQAPVFQIQSSSTQQNASEDEDNDYDDGEVLPYEYDLNHQFFNCHDGFDERKREDRVIYHRLKCDMFKAEMENYRAAPLSPV